MILRRSRSVAPPQTPSFSRTAMACSRHDALTMQILQMDLASSAAASESGKKTAGSKPLQAPWFRHDRSAPDIDIPLDHGESPRTGQCMCQASHLQVIPNKKADGYQVWLRGEDLSEVRPELRQTMGPPRDSSAGRTTPPQGQTQTVRSAFRRESFCESAMSSSANLRDTARVFLFTCISFLLSWFFCNAVGTCDNLQRMLCNNSCLFDDCCVC